MAWGNSDFGSVNVPTEKRRAEFSLRHFISDVLLSVVIALLDVDFFLRVIIGDMFLYSISLVIYLYPRVLGSHVGFPFLRFHVVPCLAPPFVGTLRMIFLCFSLRPSFKPFLLAGMV